MMDPKGIFSLNHFAQFSSSLPAVDWRLVTGDWRLCLVSLNFNYSKK